jgi:hypothetical protein
MVLADKILKMQQDRDQQLSMKRSLLATQVKETDEANFDLTYLFGDGTHAGIIAFFQAYYEELYLLNGEDTLYPSQRIDVASQQTLWVNKMTACGAVAGDNPSNPAEAWYPTTNGIGALTMNLASPWFTDSSPTGIGSGGVTAAVAAVLSAVGTAAASGSNRSSISYGTGLLGARTCDNESIVNPVPPPAFFYGDGSPDYPDYFNDGAMPSPDSSNVGNFRANLINGLASLISLLQAYSTYLSGTAALLTVIQSGGNLLLASIPLADFPLADISNIGALQSTVSSFVSNLQGLYGYFSQFPASNNLSGYGGYNKADFDANLDTNLPAELAAVASFVNSRAGAVPALLGAWTPAFSGLRKWRLFWAQQAANKPISPFISMSGISSALALAAQQIGNEEASLAVLVGDPTNYIEPTPVISAYNNPVLDAVTKLPVISRVTLLWLGGLYANKYEVLRKTLPQDPNASWSSADHLAWIIVADIDTGGIKLSYDDLSVSPGIGYVYSIIAYDSVSAGPSSPIDRMGSVDSSSNATVPYSSVDQVSCSVTLGVVTVPADTPVPTLEGLMAIPGYGIYYVTSILSATSFTISAPTLNVASGTIGPVRAAVFAS